MTGLIKSYTLESNYNTGKYVNVLPLKGKDLANVPTKSTIAVPPKYTPAAFEEVRSCSKILNGTGKQIMRRTIFKIGLRACKKFSAVSMMRSQP